MSRLSTALAFCLSREDPTWRVTWAEWAAAGLEDLLPGL